MIGILAAHGHSLDILDTHTWDQVSLLARCIAKHEVERLDLLLKPIATLAGVDYKGASVRTPAKMDKGQQEAALKMFGKQNGFF